MKNLCLALGLLVLASGANGANRSKKPSRASSYPAIIEDAEPVRSRPRARIIHSLTMTDRDKPEASPLETRRQGREAESLRELDTTIVQAPIKGPDEPVELPEPTPQVLSFDSVPETHLQSIAGRLKLIEKLILEHGRAYDYRTHTTPELQAILQRLSQEEKQ